MGTRGTGWHGTTVGHAGRTTWPPVVVPLRAAVKGVLDVAVLSVVAQAGGYGYDVVRRLREGGLTEVGDASVYGTLRRLYQGGNLTTYVVPSAEGPHRKYYALNDAGRALLERSVKTWHGFAAALEQLLGSAV